MGPGNLPGGSPGPARGFRSSSHFPRFHGDLLHMLPRRPYLSGRLHSHTCVTATQTETERSRQLQGSRGPSHLPPGAATRTPTAPGNRPVLSVLPLDPGGGLFVWGFYPGSSETRPLYGVGPQGHCFTPPGHIPLTSTLRCVCSTTGRTGGLFPPRAVGDKRHLQRSRPAAGGQRRSPVSRSCASGRCGVTG